VGDAVAVSFDFFRECLPGEGEADGEPAVSAATAVFFECLCLAGLGEAAGLGLESAVWANTDETEKTVNRMRGMSFFIRIDLSTASEFLQHGSVSRRDLF
jgi:hypothetical protein